MNKGLFKRISTAESSDQPVRKCWFFRSKNSAVARFNHKQDISHKTLDDSGGLSIEEYRNRLTKGKELSDNELKNLRAAIQMIAEQAIDRYFENLEKSERVR